MKRKMRVESGERGERRERVAFEGEGERRAEREERREKQ